MHRFWGFYLALLVFMQLFIPYYCNGIKATDKREGGGAHNWGTVKDDIE